MAEQGYSRRGEPWTASRRKDRHRRRRRPSEVKWFRLRVAFALGVPGSPCCRAFRPSDPARGSSASTVHRRHHRHEFPRHARPSPRSRWSAEAVKTLLPDPLSGVTGHLLPLPATGPLSQRILARQTRLGLCLRRAHRRRGCEGAGPGRCGVTRLAGTFCPTPSWLLAGTSDVCALTGMAGCPA